MAESIFGFSNMYTNNNPWNNQKLNNKKNNTETDWTTNAADAVWRVFNEAKEVENIFDEN